MYDLLLSEDETMIVESVREFLESELPIKRLRPGAKPTDHDAVWQGMADLGWFGVGLPESAGGSGMGIVAEMLIQRECGRNLVSPKVLATMLACRAAHFTGKDELAEALTSGEVATALAIDTTSWEPGDERKVMALDWNGSDKLFTWCFEGMGVFDPDALASPETADCIDESVTLHSGGLDLRSASAWIDISHDSMDHWGAPDILLAANLVGLAERACDLAVDYAKTREQFGKPIGSFQPIKHRCADMAVRQRLAWYQTCLAALKFEAEADDVALQIASAKLLAAEAAHENGRACIQIHGGIGFQSECDAHWFVKRALIFDQASGSMQSQARNVIFQPRPEW